MAPSDLETYLRASPNVMAVLDAARSVGLPDYRLFSGAVYQTVWNALTGRHADYGIIDYDIGYFSSDLSQDAEVEWQARVRARISEELGQRVEVVNQARVHLWFEAHFGQPFSPLRDTDSALRRFLSTVHAVGVRLEPDGSMSIAAPYGLDDVFALTLRPNPDMNLSPQHLKKTVGVVARWPQARVLPES